LDSTMLVNGFSQNGNFDAKFLRFQALAESSK